jgi:hypothetical protein
MTKTGDRFRFGWRTILVLILGLSTALIALAFTLLPRINPAGSVQPLPTFVVRAGGSELCVMSKGGAETAGADLAVELALPVLRSGFSALGRYFSKVATLTSSETEIAAARTELFEISKSSDETTLDNHLKCIVIAHAIPGALLPNALPPWLRDKDRLAREDPDELFVSNIGGEVNAARLNALGFQDIPLSYFEFTIEKDSTGSAINVVPSYVYFREPTAKLRKFDPKYIEITFTISRPTSTGYLGIPQNSPALLAQIPAAFTALRPSRSLHVDDQNFQTVWVSALPKPPGPDLQGRVIEQMAKKNKSTLQIFPVNVMVSYRESDDPVLWLEFLSDMLGELAVEKK